MMLIAHSQSGSMTRRKQISKNQTSTKQNESELTYLHQDPPQKANQLAKETYSQPSPYTETKTRNPLTTTNHNKTNILTPYSPFTTHLTYILTTVSLSH